MAHLRATSLPYEDRRTLEEIMDRSSLADMLDGLETICLEKAEHIETNWQDRATAKPWKVAARKLANVRVSVDI